MIGILKNTLVHYCNGTLSRDISFEHEVFVINGYHI